MLDARSPLTIHIDAVQSMLGRLQKYLFQCRLFVWGYVQKRSQMLMCLNRRSLVVSCSNAAKCTCKTKLLLPLYENRNIRQINPVALFEEHALRRGMTVQLPRAS